MAFTKLEKRLKMTLAQRRTGGQTDRFWPKC